MKGHLAERPIGEVLGELYHARANGILTVNREKQTKAIFIEDGNPVFALSNVPEDQLSDLLIREGRISAEKMTELGTGANVQQLAQKLAESGLISIQDLDS